VSAQTKAPLFLLLLAGVGLLGVVDSYTGRELTISAFYLIPICWGTWRIGRGAGIALSFASAATWVIADFSPSGPILPYWNALMLLVLYLPTAWLLSAFHKFHRELEQTVEIRTSELRHEIEERKRLEKEKIQAERLATVGLMAAQLAHEVRNPLGAITLTLDLLNHEFESASKATGRSFREGFDLVKETRAEVKRIERVIMDYLELARPRPSQRLPLSFRDFVEGRLSFLASTFRNSRITVTASLGSDPLPIAGDADRLWQALLNLVRNSIEAMPDGGKLSVELRREGNSAVLRLADTGCGMSPQQQERLFVPFATTKATGTGLGLPVVHQILSEHEATIRCETAPDEGTTFIVHFPLSKPGTTRRPVVPIVAQT
jgi:signal transduction histidine kinase